MSLSQSAEAIDQPLKSLFQLWEPPPLHLPSGYLPSSAGPLLPYKFSGLSLCARYVSLCFTDRVGLIGFVQERPIFYRRYVTIHSLLTVAAFGVAAAWLIISITRHNQAKSKCINDFFANTISATNDEGDTLCNIFSWADIGIMGALWVLFAIVQVMLFVVSALGDAHHRVRRATSASFCRPLERGNAAITRGTSRCNTTRTRRSTSRWRIVVRGPHATLRKTLFSLAVTHVTIAMPA